ncbi:MAG: esterase [Sphingobium sp.]|nr:MAG: esterase [Sphingobium sp.]
MRPAMLAVMFLPLVAVGLVAVQGQSGALPPVETLHYGDGPLQDIGFWPADARYGSPPPLVIFVHGGGWKRGSRDNATGAAKVAHYAALGYAFASINYRLVPDATVEEQAQDVANAVALLRGNAATLHFDPDRIVLMGHSAGAHLVALVGTDMRYFAKAGLRPDAVRGVIALDGAAYDVARQMAQAGRFMAGTYEQAFGTDADRQRLLSPTMQTERPNVPAFLILHVDRTDGAEQSEALAAALRAAGTPAEVKGFSGTGLRGHMEINRRLGDPDYPATPVVDAWLKQAFAAQ